MSKNKSDKVVIDVKAILEDFGDFQVIPTVLLNEIIVTLETTPARISRDVLNKIQRYNEHKVIAPVTEYVTQVRDARAKKLDGKAS